MNSDKPFFGSLPRRGISLDEDSVHKIRKGTKQLRARLQLLRQLEGQHHETEQLRQSVKELARILATQRDADVMSFTLQQMIAETEDLEVQQLLARLRSKLQPDPMPSGHMKRVHKLVREIEKRTKKLLKHKHPVSEVEKVLARRLAILCATGRELLTSNDWEALHDWRKQVKKLMYQYQLKPFLTPKDFFVFEHLDKLGSGLGNINDLSILERYVNAHQAESTRAHELEVYEKVHGLIDARRLLELEGCRSVFRAINNLQ